MARFTNCRMVSINAARHDGGTHWSIVNEAGEAISIAMDDNVTDHFRFIAEAVETVSLAVGLDDQFPDFEPKTKVLTKKLAVPRDDGNVFNYYECIGISIGTSENISFHFDLQYEDPFLDVDPDTCRKIVRLIDKVRGVKPIKRPWLKHVF